MKYHSTRGGFSGLSFEEALLSGFCSDGGILLPESIPALDKATLQNWAELSYPDLVKEILPLFISKDEIPRSDLNGIVDRAFSRFSVDGVVKQVKLSSDLQILELFHGPTLAFKDLALSAVGQFLEYFLEKRQKHVTVLVGTSGDTGSAAIEAVRGFRWVDIVVLLPRGRCTRVQELQMTTVIENNVHIYRVDGTSDDLDHPIKKVFMDAEFVKQHNLCSINSINWCRILIQIAHYFYAYFQASPSCDRPVQIVVPTGACGNITSGTIAYKMGLPIKLTCAVNVNDIVARTMSDADFSMSSHVKGTLAPAMDIQVPYNMERLMLLFSNGDTNLIKKVMAELEAKDAVKIPQQIHNQMKQVINGCSFSDADILSSMKRCWQENQYLMCPHTAVAAAYHYQALESSSDSDILPRVCVATASPAKFEEAVESAGLTPQPTKEILELSEKPTKFMDMEKGQDWEAILRAKITDITNTCV